MKYDLLEVFRVFVAHCYKLMLTKHYSNKLYVTNTLYVIVYGYTLGTRFTMWEHFLVYIFWEYSTEY